MRTRYVLAFTMLCWALGLVLLVPSGLTPLGVAVWTAWLLVLVPLADVGLVRLLDRLIPVDRWSSR